ncbi:MAG TPA: 30S ribosomal protein S16 [Myxococcota bacterium]|nr:30S ribosomal protein S16 [Myxococcota bacterium]
MVKLRLTRFGGKKNAFFRIIATDSRSPRDGRNLEQLGYYDPMTNPPAIKIDLARVDYWLSVGAQASDTVQGLVKRARSQGESAGAEA